MIKLRTGDFIEAERFDAIRIGKRTTKEDRELYKHSLPPRVLIDFNGSNVICIGFKTLRDAKAYAVELHEEVQQALSKEA